MKLETGNWKLETAEMALETRKNPESKKLEVHIDNQWVDFDEYRKQQIDSAYTKSIRFLRDRLDEDDVVSRYDEKSNNQNNQ